MAGDLHLERVQVDGEWHYVASDATGGGGSQPGAASRIGPYPIAFDDPGISADGIALGPFLDVGTMVLDIYTAVTTPFFTGSVNYDLQLGVVKGDPVNGDTRALVTRPGSMSGVEAGGWQRLSGWAAGFAGPVRPVIVTTGDAVKLYVVSLADIAPLLTGAADVYALVTTV